MGKHKYIVRVNIAHEVGRPNAAFDSFAIASTDHDDYEQFCEALARKLLEKIEADSEYLDEVES